MPINFKVSVIVPVYNAEKHLRKAVASAEVLEEVGEIILIEDKSPDKALSICKELEKEYEKVKLFQHPDKGNHGAGASRNLGINKAKFDYIAFLDADDYYLINRFIKDKEVFEHNSDCEGVYSAVGTDFYSESAREDFFSKGLGYQETLTLTDTVPPEELFSVLFSRHPLVKGQFCTDGITVKKSVFQKVGLFNTELRLRQDIHLWRRMAGFCRLYAGEIKQSTAMRVIHQHNRMTVKEDHNQYIDLWWKSLKLEFQRKHLNKEKYVIFEQAYFNYYAGSNNKIIALKTFIVNAFKRPEMIRENYGFFDLNFWKVFGRNKLSLSVISFKNKLFNSK